jgi:hypothetical protein
MEGSPPENARLQYYNSEMESRGEIAMEDSPPKNS